MPPRFSRAQRGGGLNVKGRRLDHPHRRRGRRPSGQRPLVPDRSWRAAKTEALTIERTPPPGFARPGPAATKTR